MDPNTGAAAPMAASIAPTANTMATAQVRYAGFWIRFVAVFIDGLILGVVIFVLITILSLIFGVSLSSTQSKSSPLTGIILLLELVLAMGYWVFLQSAMGQTIGKKAMHIKVINKDGSKPSLFTFFLREIIGKIISGLVLDLGYLWVAWDSKKQAWHDKIAGTYVVRV